MPVPLGATVQRVTLASDDPGVTLLTAISAAETAGNVSLASLDAKNPALGQALAAASVPVTLTAAEEAQIGSLTETAPATDTASSGLNGRLQRIAQRLTAFFGTAGSPTANVLSVQGVSSGTTLPVTSTGSVAHDGVDSGNPVKVGGMARTTWPAAVSDADRANLITDKFGRTIVTSNPRDLRGNQQTTITSSTAETTIVTAGAAGVFNDVHDIVIANTSATACNVTIKDATAGTTRFVFAVPSGQTVRWSVPSCDAHKQVAAANNWTATCGTSVASISITALYVSNKDA